MKNFEKNLDSILEELPDLLTRKQVPYYSAATLANLEARGKGIPNSTRLGKTILYNKSDVREWLLSRAKEVKKHE